MTSPWAQSPSWDPIETKLNLSLCNFFKDSTIKDLLNNVEQYINLPATDKWDDQFIKDIDIDYVLERGQKKDSCIYTYYLK